MTVRAWTAAALAALLSFLIAGALRLDPVPPGLSASYESLGGPSRTASATDQPSTDAVLQAWGGNPPDAFRATWHGTVYVPKDGAFTFATRSDEESTIYLDGRVILENGGGLPGLLPVREVVRPDLGSHAIIVKYIHNGGPVHFDLLWAEGNDGDLEAIPAWALRPRRVGDTRMLASKWLPRALAGCEWLTAALFVLATLGSASRAAAALAARLKRAGAPESLEWIVGASAILNLTGLWWGLPGGSWAPIEMTPVFVIGALSSHFSNGWWDPYPPVHYSILSLAISPVLVLSWLGRLKLETVLWTTVMMVIVRLVSVVMAAGTVVAVYLSGQIAFGRRAGLFAAATFALVAPFLYFAKMANVDVPYLFWFSLSLVFYLRALENDRLGDYVGLAATTALAVCTKDQAYGLYLLPPIVIIWRRGLNRRVFVAAAVSIALFLVFQNVLFNLAGFKLHLAFLTGNGSEGYRLFDRTLRGQLGELRLVARLTELSWGWPLSLVCIAGVGLALRSPASRRPAIALLAPAAGYYVGFFAVILYAYDRFTLPLCLILAIFGGYLLDTLTAAGAPTWRRAAVGLAFAYTLLYSTTVDVLMVRDSRYWAEHFLHGQTITPDDLIADNTLPYYLPRLNGYKVGEVQTIEDFQMAQPKFFVHNVDYFQGENPASLRAQLLDGLEQHRLGYTLVLRARTKSPWPWLPGAHPDLVGPRLTPTVVSSLRYINPTIEIFQHDTTIGR